MDRKVECVDERETIPKRPAGETKCKGCTCHSYVECEFVESSKGTHFSNSTREPF